MSELCVDCLNKLMGTKDSARKYIVSRELDLCEECGEWKRIVICEKKQSIQHLKIFRKKKGGY